MRTMTGKTSRPIALTIICVIGFIGSLFSFPLVFTTVAQQVGTWYPPYLALAAVTGLVCMVGLLMMKKWAAYTYAGLAALNQVVLLAMGLWNILALLIPAIVVFVALKNSSKMS